MIKIAQCYIARFTKVEMPVRIESLEVNGTWKARSLTHGRIVFVKNESQILRECSEQDLLELAKTVAPNRRSKKQQTTLTPQSPVETPVATRERKPKAKRPSVPEFTMTALDAAHRVLSESKKPLTSQEIVDQAFKKKYHRSSGATPSNTINAAILRVIKRDGEQARFVKAGRGMFTVR
jgi:hypothetical protein